MLLAAELVESTPLGLSSDQMKKSNPDAVTLLQNQSAKSETDRCIALTAAFGDDPTFLQAAIKDGLTVEQAKAKQYDTLKAQAATLQAENVKLKQGNVVGFAAGDKPAPAATAPKTEGEAFEAEALAYWNGHEKVRAEFGGIFTDFRADYKYNRGEYPA